MLGRFAVRQEDREITRFRTQKTASLLACLSLCRSQSHPRDVLIEQFWPDSDLKAARTNLSVALNALRRQLEPPGVPPGAVLITDHSQVRLNPIAYSTDVEEFNVALRTAASENNADGWTKAVDLYHGDLLPGFYDDWILTQRERIRDTYLATLRQTVEACVDTAQPERAIVYARRLVQAEPLCEDSHRLLMRLFLTAGRQQDALHQYRVLERLLRDTLQTEPCAETRELAASLRRIPSLPRKIEHAPDTFTRSRTAVPPALPHVSDLPRPPHKLPVQFTRFFGREEEIQRLIDGLSPAVASKTRLITLTGMGGSGKTRLAIETAARVREMFPGGIWFVPLAEVDDPLRFGEALRDALELPRQQQSVPLEQVIAFLNARQGPSLLILDNFEHLTAGGAPVVWTLLSRLPGVWYLVTSRQPLSLPGEREIPVPPLPVSVPLTGRKGGVASWCVSPSHPLPLLEATSPAEFMAYPSVALFVDRAQAVRPEFQITPKNAGAIAAICERLEGIPLAIELAAARARILTPAQIAARLTERFELLAARRPTTSERHCSLWAAIDWSFHLLSPDLQRLFARLSVFRGGWTLEAAEAVSGSLEPERNILDSLAQLRGHSLLQAEESTTAIRFRMLETLREFAAEQLTAEERVEMLQRHATYFHQWVTGARQIGAERNAWFERFDEDIDNLRAALSWSLDDGGAIAIGIQTASSLNNFWWLRGHLSEGRRWYARLLDRAGDAPLEGLDRSLCAAGTLAYLQGDFPAAIPLLERCMAVAQASGKEEVVGAAHDTLGSIAYRKGEYEQARLHYGQSLEAARLAGNGLRSAGALGNLANVAQSTGDFATSRALNEESLELWRAAGDRNGEARTLHNLANLALSQGQVSDARAFYEQSLAIKRELADRYGICSTLRGIAEAAMNQRDFAAAAACIRESIALTREQDARTELVQALHLMADFLWASEDFETATRMYGAMERARDETHYPLAPIYQAEYARTQNALRESLTPAAYDAAKTEGRNLTLDQALDYLEDLLEDRSF
jgi:predicted ATPase/DNA-binding SARP family transcriptional activator